MVSEGRPMVAQLPGTIWVMRAWWCFISVLAFSFAPLQARAQVTVSSVIVNFKATQRPVQTITVGNGSNFPAYVLASIEQVLDPEKGGDHSKPSDEVLVSPKAFSIEPNGQRAVRLLLRNPAPEHEMVYRALFVPQDRGFGQEIKREISGHRANIRVLTGMGILLYVEPKAPEKKFHWTRNAQAITFINDGNIHMELASGKSCDAHGENCTDLDGKRIYAGSSYDVKVAKNRKVTFLNRMGAAGEFEQLVVEPVADDSTDH